MAVKNSDGLRAGTIRQNSVRSRRRSARQTREFSRDSWKIKPIRDPTEECYFGTAIPGMQRAGRRRYILERLKSSLHLPVPLCDPTEGTSISEAAASPAIARQLGPIDSLVRFAAAGNDTAVPLAYMPGSSNNRARKPAHSLFLAGSSECRFVSSVKSLSIRSNRSDKARTTARASASAARGLAARSVS
jgi:hypothetical protein